MGRKRVNLGLKGGIQAPVTAYGRGPRGRRRRRRHTEPGGAAPPPLSPRPRRPAANQSAAGAGLRERRPMGPGGAGASSQWGGFPLEGGKMAAGRGREVGKEARWRRRRRSMGLVQERLREGLGQLDADPGSRRLPQLQAHAAPRPRGPRTRLWAQTHRDP